MKSPKFKLSSNDSLSANDNSNNYSVQSMNASGSNTEFDQSSSLSPLHQSPQVSFNVNSAIADLEEQRNVKLKKENSWLQKEVKNCNSRISSLEKENTGLLMKLNEANSELSHIRLQRSQQSISEVTIHCNESSIHCSENNDINNAVYDSYNNMIESQSHEISSLHDQREGLIKLIQKYRAVSLKSDNVIDQMHQRILEMDQENLILQEGYYDLEKQLTDQSQKSESQISEIYDLLISKIPPEVYDELQNEEPEYQVKLNEQADIIQAEILRSINALFNFYDNNARSSEREINVLAHLENAIKLVNTLLNSHGQDTPKDIRTRVLTQAAKINQFIQEQYGNEEMQHVADLFQSGNPEEQIETFYAFIDKKEMDTPLKELYLLFCGVIEVNSILFNHLDTVQECSEIPPQKLHEIQNENQQLHKFYQDVNSKLESIADLLSDAPIEHSDDIFDTIYAFIEKYLSIIKNGSISQQSTQEIEPNSPLLHQQYLQSIAKIKKYREIVTKMKTKLAHEKEKRTEFEAQAQEAINSLEMQLKEANETINQLRSNEKKLTEQRKKFANELKKSNQKNDELTLSLAQFKEKNMNHNGYGVVPNCISVNEYTQLKEQIMQEKIVKLKKKVLSLESEHKRNAKTTEVQQQYKNRINSLEFEVDSSKEMISDLQSKLTLMTSEKNDLIQQVAKLKVSERSYQMKIAQMEDFIKFKNEEKDCQKKAHELSKSSESDKRIGKLKEQIKKNESLLRCFIESQFNTRLKKDLTFQEMISMLEKIIIKSSLFFSKETLKDAAEIRKRLKLKNTDSILDAFSVLRDTIDNGNAEIYNTKTDNKRYLDEINSFKEEAKRIDTVKSKLSDWEKWAARMFSQIAEGRAVPILSMNDIRYSLEEALLSSFGHRTIRRKLGILRVEKAIICQHYDDIATSQGPLNVRHIKPLISFVLFLRKIQSFAGCVPPKFKTVSFQPKGRIKQSYSTGSTETIAEM